VQALPTTVDRGKPSTGLS